MKNDYLFSPLSHPVFLFFFCWVQILIYFNTLESSSARRINELWAGIIFLIAEHCVNRIGKLRHFHILFLFLFHSILQCLSLSRFLYHFLSFFFLLSSLSLLYLYLCFHVPLSVFFFSISLSFLFENSISLFHSFILFFSLSVFLSVCLSFSNSLLSFSLYPYSHKERRWQTIFVNGLGVDPFFVYSSYATERERERETKSVFIYFFLVYLKANFVSAHTTTTTACAPQTLT